MDEKIDNIEQYRKKYTRSGSIGLSFLPEKDVKHILKKYMSIADSEEKIENGYETNDVVFILRIPSNHTQTMSGAISLLEKNRAVIKHIESRESKNSPSNLDLLIRLTLDENSNVDLEYSKKKLAEILEKSGIEVSNALNLDGVKNCRRRSSLKNNLDGECEDDVFLPNFSKELVADSPWFPRTIRDLDISSKRVLMYGSDLDADHPGFKDPEYRKRRMMFAEIALNYSHGAPIPRVEYTDSEKATWATIYSKLRELHKKHACKEYLENFVLLEKYCNYKSDNIPQLHDISTFLKAKTGFRLRPVAGYLSSRDFLAGLAFRVFHCTQYIRHPADPMYSPEPDCCHEILGHMPLFADPDFAQFSQEIGLASLGASEEDLQKLATLYFFTIEFGLCKQFGEMKIYGAGLLSSIAELKHAIEDYPSILPFDPNRVVKQECLITTFQVAYFYTENFEEVQQKIRLFTSEMKRPFVVRYNPYTESVEVLNTKRALTMATNTLRSDVNLLASALHKL